MEDIRQWPMLFEKSQGLKSKQVKLKGKQLNVLIQSVSLLRELDIRSMKHGMTASLESFKNECTLTVRLTTIGTQHLLNQPSRSD